MNSRERVNAVLNHQKPDRMPNCWGGCETAGLHVLAYNNLVAALGLPPRPPRVDTFMFNAVMDDDVLKAMGGDMLMIASPLMCRRPLRAREGWHTLDLFGTKIEMTDNYGVDHTPDMVYLLSDGKRDKRSPVGGTYFDVLTSEDLFSFAEVPDPADFHPNHELPEEKLRSLENAAKEAYETTDYALSLGESITDLQLTPGGMVAWFEALLNEPDVTDEYLSKCVDAALDQITQLDQAVGKYCCVMSIAHDLGDSRGVTMGANLFRERYKKHYKRLFDGWHKRTGMKINLHSCGSIAEILPDLIDCGVDVLNPVQISAADMDPENLRRIANDKLIFHGGAFDAIQTPPDTDPRIVYEQVKKNIAALNSNGFFLFAGVHNTPADTPVSHIKAILEAVKDCQ